MHPTAPVHYFFFFPVTPTTEIYTLSLHDALPIFDDESRAIPLRVVQRHPDGRLELDGGVVDRKSTRLNSSHEWISYAVFCLKKKKDADVVKILKIFTILPISERTKLAATQSGEHK